MSVGLIALLDDVTALAKVAAASVDDVAAQAAKAGAKAAGVVIDDAAVAPKYVVGFAAARELPIIGKIAAGSLRNKLVFLLPAALALSFLAPWLITPLLMLGGAYLSYEGTEKVYEAIFPHQAHAHEAKLETVALKAETLEDQKVASAIKTDFILSAEIMAITLAAIPGGGFWMQSVVLAIVGIGVTAVVYGSVAIIVKADDFGVALAKRDTGSTTGAVLGALGRAIVLGMPYLLTALSVVGTAAMIWVGGSIVVHGLEGSIPAIAHTIHDIAEAVGHAVPAFEGAVEWLVSAAGYGVVGLALGAVLIPIVEHLLGPVWRSVKRIWPNPHGA